MKLPSLSIAAKLYAIFALLATVTVALALLSAFNANRHAAMTGEFEAASRGAQLVERLNGQIYAARLELRGIFLSADDVAAIVAAAIIAANGWRLLRPALNELMDRAPSREMIERIRRIAQSVPGVEAVEKCLVRKMGYNYYVDMHVEVDPQMSVQRSHEIAHDVKNRVRQRIHPVRDVLVHIEPARRIPSTSL